MLSSPKTSDDALDVFFSYAHEDEALRDELANHLTLLEREGKIRPWYDREILPGDTKARRIDERLESADLVLFLVSPDFLASDYCWNVEVKRALTRHEDGGTRVIPIVVRPVDWETAPFAKLQALPIDLKPVTSWKNQDKAWLDVAKGIRSVIEEVLERRQEDAKRCLRLLTTLYDSVDDLRHLAEDLGWTVDVELADWDALEAAASWLARRAAHGGSVRELEGRIAEDHPMAPGVDEPSGRPRADVVNRVLQLLARPDLPGVALLEPYGFGGREVVHEVMIRLADQPEVNGHRTLPERLVPDRRTLSEARLYGRLLRNLRRELERHLGRPLPDRWDAALSVQALDGLDFEEALEDLLRGPVTDEGWRIVVAVEGLSRMGEEDLLTWAAVLSRLTMDLPLKVLAWGGGELFDLCTGYTHLEHGSPFERLEAVELEPLVRQEMDALAPGRGEVLARVSGGHSALVNELLQRGEAELQDGDADALVAWGLASPLLRRLRREVEGDAEASAVIGRLAHGKMERRGEAGEEFLRWWGIIAMDGPRRWRWIAPVFEEWARTWLQKP